MARDGKFATIKLPSGETRLILVNVMLSLDLFLILIINLLFLEKLVEQDGWEEDQELEQL